ncbi:hypothetical protein [Streptomyces sp. DT117]|uniref:hypothetical protein n=1 Tax=Streptomyces sp. DT117 TaxID=3393422 RepID=UPI003CE8D88C
MVAGRPEHGAQRRDESDIADALGHLVRPAQRVRGAERAAGVGERARHAAGLGRLRRRPGPAHPTGVAAGNPASTESDEVHQNVDWLKSFYPPGFSLVFARDLEPGEITARLGCPPEAHRFMTVEDADDHAAEQSDDRELFRAGTAGEWSFAVQPRGARSLNDDAAVARVSQGTESWFW